MLVVVSLFEPDAAICACVGARFVQVDVYFRVTEGTSTSVACCDPGVQETDWFTLDHGHGAERLWLEIHGCLLEAGACMCVRAASLVGRPWYWVVGCLGDIGDG